MEISKPGKDETLAENGHIREGYASDQRKPHLAKKKKRSWTRDLENPQPVP